MTKLFNILEYIILILIFGLTTILTYTVLGSYVNIVDNKMIINEKEVISNPNIIINEKDLENYLQENDIIINAEESNEDIEKEISEINKVTDNDLTLQKKDNNMNNFDDYYKMSFKNKDFLISNDEKSYDYGFISKQIKNNIMYLYSHNNYKFTENSGYYLYNNLNKNDIITFNGDKKYKVVSTSMINYDDNTTNKNIGIKENVDIIYFTCTPDGENIRKLYQLKEITN